MSRFSAWQFLTAALPLLGLVVPVPGLTAAEPSPPASPFGPATCEGAYPKHLQGICTDGDRHLFWCFTDALVKTDAAGRRLAQVPVPSHHGDLCWHAGKVYVAVNLGKFNQPAGAADSWIYVYRADDLQLLGRHAVPELVHGAGGIATDGRRLIVVGGLPPGSPANQACQYDLELNFVARLEIPGGYTLMGIQTAAYADGHWWFGCYGAPKILLKTDAELRFVGRYVFDAAYGLAPVSGGRFLVARDRLEKGVGHRASVVLADAHPTAGLLISAQSTAAPAARGGEGVLAAGTFRRELSLGERTRTYQYHVPPGASAARPLPVVLAFHGAGMNGTLMMLATNLNAKADAAGFVVVYPDGTGSGPFLTWNADGWRHSPAGRPPDDVAFVACLLDDLATVVPVDPRRVYATGLSNGGMMCYKLAASLADRIAAIAPVAGTMAQDKVRPLRPVPILHLHGTRDTLVPFDGPAASMPLVAFKSVDATIQAWCAANGCPSEPVIDDLPDLADDGTTVRRKVYGPGKEGAEIVLLVIDGGGHTWPGRPSPLQLLGRSTRDVAANDLLWDFFQRHPLQVGDSGRR